MHVIYKYTRTIYTKRISFKKKKKKEEWSEVKMEEAEPGASVFITSLAELFQPQTMCPVSFS